MGYVVYVRNKKTKAGERGIWPEKKRIEALTTFMATGSQAMTSAMTKIPEETIRSWRKQDWWKERMDELKSDNTVQLDTRLTKVMDKALDAVIDRIENGEYMYDPRTGEIHRIPAKLRDLQRVANDSIDKKLLLTKRNTQEQAVNKQITADHLVQLAKEFAKFANKGKAPSEAADLKHVIEGEHTEVFEELGLDATPIKEADKDSP